jgi:hypothetical protein
VFVLILSWKQVITYCDLREDELAHFEMSAPCSTFGRLLLIGDIVILIMRNNIVFV